MTPATAFRSSGGDYVGIYPGLRPGGDPLRSPAFYTRRPREADWDLTGIIVPRLRSDDPARDPTIVVRVGRWAEWRPAVKPFNRITDRPLGWVLDPLLPAYDAGEFVAMLLFTAPAPCRVLIESVLYAASKAK